MPVTNTNEHAHARAYLKRLPPDMEAAAVIRTLLDGLDREQGRREMEVEELERRVTELTALLEQVEQQSSEPHVVELARKRHFIWGATYG